MRTYQIIKQKLLVVAVTLLMSIGVVGTIQAQVELPYQLQNGQPANADQVMANFNALVKALEATILPERNCKAILDLGSVSLQFIDDDGDGGTDSGVYQIAPGRTPISVYCDMTTDGGGWTLVAYQHGAAAGNTGFKRGDSQNATCLQSNNLLVGTGGACDQTSWQSKKIRGSEYMIQMGRGNPITKSTPLVASFDSERDWYEMRYAKPNSPSFATSTDRVNHTYYVNGSETFLGYSADVSSAGGCQDGSVLDSSYLFAVSDGDSFCGTSRLILLESPGNPGSGGYYQGWHAKGILYVR